MGKRIAELCGRDIRRVTLELGGKSAAIMLDDVDVEKAVPGIVACSVAMLQGEICTAQSRILAPARATTRSSTRWRSRSPRCRSAIPPTATW